MDQKRGIDETELQRDIIRSLLKKQNEEIELRKEELALRKKELGIEKEEEREKKKEHEEDIEQKKTFLRKETKVLSGGGYHVHKRLGNIIMITIVLILLLGVLSPIFPTKVVIEKSKTLFEQATSGIGKGATFYSNYMDVIEQQASGEYAKGVQEKTKRKLGVKLSTPFTYNPENTFKEGEPIVVWSELSAEVFDENEDAGEAVISCKARDDKINGTADPERINLNSISGSSKGISCTFQTLKDRDQYIDIYATFPFKTEAYKPIVYLDESEIEKLGPSTLKRVEEPDTTYTPGPAQIGADSTQNFPLPASEICSLENAASPECYSSLTLTIDEEGLDVTSGYFKEIKKVEMKLFGGVQIYGCSPVRFDNTDENLWVAKEEDLKRIGKIEKALTIQCKLAVNYNELIDPEKKAQPVANQIQIKTEYDYEIKKSLLIKIKKDTTTTTNTETTTTTVNPAKVYSDHKTTIDKAANDYSVEKSLIIGIISQESKGNSRAVSTAGAAGLMQLMPLTAQELGLKVTSSTTNCNYYNKLGCDYEGDERFNEEKNVDAGTKYLKQQLDKYNGNIELALAAYNWGFANVDKSCTLEKGIEGCNFGTNTETPNYITKVLAYKKEYETTTIA